MWSSEAPWSATWPPDDSLGECSHVLHSDVHGKVPYPCDATTEIVHYLGDTSSFLQCENRLNHLNGQGRTGPYGVHKDVPVTPGVAAFSNPQPSGGESTAAPAVTFDGSSGWSIPPATSVTAGASAMYAVQSLPARSTDGLPIARFPIVTSAAGQVFKAGWLFKMVAPNVELACQVCRGFACLTYSANYYNSGWQGYYFYRQLWSVDATYEGNLMLKTNPDYELASWSSPSSGPTLPFSVSHTR